MPNLPIGAGIPIHLTTPIVRLGYDNNDSPGYEAHPVPGAGGKLTADR
jgi:hypothetical protein